MSRFQVLSTAQASPLPETKHADAPMQPAAGVASFDVDHIDTVLVFWPHKPVDLTHVANAATEPSTQHEMPPGTLLVGTVVHGHSSEAAVVVIGTLPGCASDAVLSKIASERLQVVGSMSAEQDDLHRATVESGSGSSTLPSCSIWLTMLSPLAPHELPSVVSVALSDTRSSIGSRRKSSLLRPHTQSCAVSVIAYSAPRSSMLQYFALESLRLAPVSGVKLVSTASALLVPDAQLPEFSKMMAASCPSSRLQNKFLQLLMLDPVHWRSLRCIQAQHAQAHRGTALRRCIELINQLSAKHERLALQSAPTASDDAPNASAAHKPLAGASGRRLSLLRWLADALTRAALAVQAALRHSLYVPSQRVVLIDGVAHRSASAKSSPVTLTSVSACARQLDMRISQIVVAPRLASRLRYVRTQQKLPIDQIAAPYIGLWNAIWLIANDIILGHAASVLLLQSKSELAHVGRELVGRSLLHSVLWLLSWLQNWPAGLKLNTELSLFFSDAYSSLTNAWHSHALVHVLPRLETVIWMMALAGRCMGVTMTLCMLQDLASVCTLHITVLYTLSFRTLRAFVYVLCALFDVFRGKKRNALRGGRLDDASYELDQLLLGTLLFTLVAFLLPTVYVYYVAFGVIRFGVVAFDVGVVQTWLGLLNHLPLFALMLRIKDPLRLPAGVWLQEMAPAARSRSTSMDDRHDAHVLATRRYRLRSRPLSVGDIFEGYGEHVGGLVEIPSMLLRCIVGRPLRRSAPPLA